VLAAGSAALPKPKAGAGGARRPGRATVLTMSRRYIAFLRGINVGSRRRIKMDELNAVFTSLGFSEVTTLIASGNVAFTSPDRSEAAVTTAIEDAFEAAFGFRVHTIVRTLADVRAMIELEPFKGEEVRKETRLYVTLLPTPTTSTLPLPHATMDGDCRILSRTDREVFSVLTLNAGRKSVDAMAILEKEYGKNVTTRNWNTILKLPKA
jgi:uncharacterized protein (DUF1697 family)